jgi:hypothetical protein
MAPPHRDMAHPQVTDGGDSLNIWRVVANIPRVVTGEKNSPTIAHACRKRRLKWVLGA